MYTERYSFALWEEHYLYDDIRLWVSERDRVVFFIVVRHCKVRVAHQFEIPPILAY